MSEMNSRNSTHSKSDLIQDYSKGISNLPGAACLEESDSQAGVCPDCPPCICAEDAQNTASVTDKNSPVHDEGMEIRGASLKDGLPAQEYHSSFKHAGRTEPGWDSCQGPAQD